MKGFKRFLKIFGICLGAVIGFVGIFLAIVAISGGFNPDPIDITNMSFVSNGNAPGDEVASITIIDTYTAKIYYEPDDASEKQISLTLVGGGADIVSLSSTMVNAGEEFTITPKKRTIEIKGQEYEVNVGGEVEIIAKSPNNYKSCKLYITVDVEVPAEGLHIVGMDGGEYVYSESQTALGYKLNRVGTGLFQLAIQATPSNALEPNTGRYAGAINMGYKKAYLTLPEDSGFEVIGNPTTRVSYYSPTAKKYFSYSLYSTVARKNTNGTYSLTVGDREYSDLIITEHYIYTLQLSEGVENNNYDIVAKVFKTYAIQQDFLLMQANFADHTAPNVNEYAIFCNFVAKYKEYVTVTEAGATFLASVTNSVGDIQINTLEGYNTAMSFLYVYAYETFILEDIDIISMNTEKTDITFELHSPTYTTEDSEVITYSLDSLSKEDIISMFKINLSVEGASSPITKWVGDVFVLSLKEIDASAEWDDIIEVDADGNLSISSSDYDNSNSINVSYTNGSYKIEILDELLTDSLPVLLFATKYGAGDTFTTGYKFCVVRVGAIRTNIASGLSINTNTSMGGVNTTMVTNMDSLYGVKQQNFDATKILLGLGQTDQSAPLSYTKVKLFAVDESNLFIGSGTAYPKVQLGSHITYMMNSSSTVVNAYELPDIDGEYYIRALNNSGGSGKGVKIFAAIVKTDINGDVVESGTADYIFINKSAEVAFDINTYAEAMDLNWYVKTDDTHYKKGVLANADLKLLLYERYDILATLHDLNSSGEVILPGGIEAGVNYLYNMGYAFADFSSNCNTASKFKANEGTGIISTTAIDEVVISAGIKAIKVTIDAVQSTSANTPIERRKLIAEGYSNNGLELSISRIFITTPIISLEGIISELPVSGTHVLNPLVVSKEFTSGRFEWTATANGVTITSPNGAEGVSFTIKLNYNTDIDVYDDGENVIWSSKIDEALRTEENLNKYRNNFATQFTTGEGSIVWTSSDTNIAELSGENNDRLTISAGSFKGESFNISCQINTYQHNNPADQTTVVAYMKSREYPVTMKLHVLQPGAVTYVGEPVAGETHNFKNNSTIFSLALTSLNNDFDFELVDSYYIVDNDNNIISNINVFDALFKASNYSLEDGDIIQLSGNAHFLAGAGGKTIILTNNIINSGELNIELDDFSGTPSLFFQIIKKRTNIYTDAMKAGQMIVITSKNATFYNEITLSYGDCIVITEDMIASKTILATLNSGAESTEINFIVCDEQWVLNDARLDKEFEDLKKSIPENGSLRLSIANAVFIVTNSSGHSESYATTTIESTTDLSTIKIAFSFENSEKITAQISYSYFDQHGDMQGDSVNLPITLTAFSGSNDANIIVPASDYSYKTNKQIDVLYNGVSLLTGTISIVEDTADRVLDYGGVKFELSSGATWVVNGGAVSIEYDSAGPIEVTISINGYSQKYYLTAAI